MSPLMFVLTAILAGLATGGACIGLAFFLVWLEKFANGDK